MSLLSCDKVYLVLTGNYGSGKTEIALNLALESAKRMKTTLVDLDIEGVKKLVDFMAKFEKENA